MSKPESYPSFDNCTPPLQPRKSDHKLAVIKSFDCGEYSHPRIELRAMSRAYDTPINVHGRLPIK